MQERTKAAKEQLDLGFELEPELTRITTNLAKMRAYSFAPFQKKQSQKSATFFVEKNMRFLFL